MKPKSTGKSYLKAKSIKKCLKDSLARQQNNCSKFMIDYPNNGSLAFLVPKTEPPEEPEPGDHLEDQEKVDSKPLAVSTFLRTYSKKKPVQPYELLPQQISVNPITPVEYHDEDAVKEEAIYNVKVIGNCRLCLREITSKGVPIWGDSGIYEKVIRCSAVNVLETDEFQFVCLLCKHHLDYINRFQEICRKSNEMFLEMTFVKKEDPFPDSLNQDEIIEPPSEHKLEEIHSEDEKEQEYPCEECPMISFQEEDYLIHQKSHRMRCKYFRIRRLELCPFCGIVLTSLKWAPHMRSHSSLPPKKCDECGKMISGNAFYQHKRNHKIPVVPGDCKLCGNKFKSKHSLTRHLAAVHRQQPLVSCPCCSRQFNCSSNMRVHLRTHTGEMPYACPDCGICFSHRVTMKLHRLKEHKINMFDPPIQKDRLKRKRRRRNKKDSVAPSQEA